MLNYKLKIGIAPMRRNTTDRPPRTFLTWSSAEAVIDRFRAEAGNYCIPAFNVYNIETVMGVI